MTTIAKIHAKIANYSHASTNIRTSVFYYAISATSPLQNSGVTDTLGFRLPQSVTICSIRRITSSFRPHCVTTNGHCVCQV